MTDVLLPGTRLGLYEIVSRICHNEPGRIYRARRVDTGEDRLLKMHSLTGPKEHIASLDWEAEIGAIVGRHPNVVTVYEAGEADGWKYVSMDFVAGRAVDEIMVNEYEIEPKRALKITLDIASGLEHMHSKNIVHRDVKVSNIIVDDKKATLIDLGIAYDLNRKLPPCREGCCYGTLGYLPPEYACGFPPHKRGDVYSLGTTLVYMLLGYLPPAKVDEKHLDREIRIDFPKMIFGSNSIPEPLKPVCMEAVAFNHILRYQSIREFAAALNKVLEKF